MTRTCQNENNTIIFDIISKMECLAPLSSRVFDLRLKCDTRPVFTRGASVRVHTDSGWSTLNYSTAHHYTGYNKGRSVTYNKTNFDAICSSLKKKNMMKYL